MRCRIWRLFSRSRSQPSSIADLELLNFDEEDSEDRVKVVIACAVDTSWSSEIWGCRGRLMGIASSFDNIHAEVADLYVARPRSLMLGRIYPT